jgi:hypothetical protein
VGRASLLSGESPLPLPFKLAAAAAAAFSCCWSGAVPLPFDFSPFKESLNLERPRGMMELVDQIMRWWWGIGIRRDQTGEWPQARQRSVWCLVSRGGGELIARGEALYQSVSPPHSPGHAVAGCQLDDMRCCSGAVVQWCSGAVLRG